MINLTDIRETIGGLIAPSLLEKRNQALRAANTDALTGLANREALNLALPSALAAGFAFIVFDANNFGKVNKIYGHKLGDEILQGFAGALGLVAKHFKARAFRMGGDEFVIICSPKFAESIRDRAENLARGFVFPEFIVSISGEIGVSIEDADSRLQERKSLKKSIPF